MVLLGKIMILQGLGHQISCLGVCCANDPQKGGYTTPAPALDLTTSLRCDLLRGHSACAMCTFCEAPYQRPILCGIRGIVVAGHQLLRRVSLLGDVPNSPEFSKED